MRRGCLTDDIQKLANEFLKRDIDQVELRLYPYIDFVIKNTGLYKLEKINWEERDILIKLAVEGHIALRGGDGFETEYIYVTKDFYNYIQKVLWLSYVETKLEEEDGN